MSDRPETLGLSTPNSARSSDYRANTPKSFDSESHNETHSPSSQTTEPVMPGETLPQRQRPREVAGGEEEASATLNLGEFENVPTLSNSEARLLMQAVRDRREKTGQVMAQTE